MDIGFCGMPTSWKERERGHFWKATTLWALLIRFFPYSSSLSFELHLSKLSSTEVYACELGKDVYIVPQSTCQIWYCTIVICRLLRLGEAQQRVPGTSVCHSCYCQWIYNHFRRKIKAQFQSFPHRVLPNNQLWLTIPSHNSQTLACFLIIHATLLGIPVYFFFFFF